MPSRSAAVSARARNSSSTATAAATSSSALASKPAVDAEPRRSSSGETAEPPQMTESATAVSRTSSTPPMTREEYAQELFDAWMSRSDFKEVPVILDFAEDEGIRQAEAFKASGTPFIIRGVVGLAKFSYKWLRRRDGTKKSAPITSLLDGPFDLDLDSFLADVGDEIVPIVTPNYDGSNPKFQHISVRKFVQEAWVPDSTKYYMHQWQFPTNERAINKLCFRSDPLVTLGLDMLQYWHDSCSRGSNMDSPFQYLFMGGTNTCSKLHRDTGGLSILISPIVGRKEMIICHRDDGRLLSHCAAPLEQLDYINYPLSAFARSWKVILSPGDTLVLPAGTYHAATNVEPCLSYTRFHMDQLDISHCLNSWFAGDSPTINHTDIIWNAGTELSKILDDQTARLISGIALSCKKKPAPSIRQQLEDRDAFKHLTLLRHAVQSIINLIEVQTKNPFHANSPVANITDHQWGQLLLDIDDSLQEFLFAKNPNTNLIPDEPCRESPKKRVLVKSQGDLVIEQEYFGAKRKKAGGGVASAPPEPSLSSSSWESSRSSSNNHGADSNSNEIENGNGNGNNSKKKAKKDVKASPAAISHVLVQNSVKISTELVEPSPPPPSLPPPPPPPPKPPSTPLTPQQPQPEERPLLFCGARVAVGDKRTPAEVLDVVADSYGCRIHYDGFENVFDEFIICSDLRDTQGQLMAIDQIKLGTKAIALWGSLKDEYIATVLPCSIPSKFPALHSEIDTRCLYFGTLVKVRIYNQKRRDFYDRYYPLEEVFCHKKPAV